MQGTFHIRTYGCQMNERDSEALARLLEDRGMVPAPSEDTADVLVFNTCSVRDQAERKAVGKVQLMKRLKRTRPEIVVGIVGCMAQNRGEALFEAIPHLDFVLGTDQLHRLPEVVERVRRDRQPVALTATGSDILGSLTQHQGGSVQRSVAVMRGCDQFCAYCIVPYVRGREKSRPEHEILDEVKALAEDGAKEILLLGQNITAYGVSEDRRRNGRWSGKSWFAELLRRVNEVDGIERIRFTSPHVKYMTDDFVDAVAETPKVCESLHLPVQSGSDRILQAMRRGYTADEFRDRVRRIRHACPEMTFSTDIIVGFPGETEEDFQATRHLMRDIGFDMAYIFRYSVRSGTAAEAFGDSVRKETKEQRNKLLLAELEAYAARRNKRLEGRCFEVLVEGPSKRNPHRWTGRTRTNKVCVFEPDEACGAGALRTVRVDRSTPSSLIGRLAS